MNVRRFFLVAVSAATLAVGLGSANAQNRANAQNSVNGAEGVNRASLFDTLEQPRVGQSHSNVRLSKKSVAELRQERALYRSNQRIARLEYNLWMGREPLRPRWNSIPMMTSRYGRNRIYVPVYIYP